MRSVYTQIDYLTPSELKEPIRIDSSTANWFVLDL